MTATNHAVTGALVAIGISRPAVGLPLALLSHFVTDCLPHWDYYGRTKQPKDKRNFGALDFCVAIAVLAILAFTAAAPVWLILAGGLLGIAPDFMWLPFILKGKASITSNKKNPMNWIRRVHLRIQWLETKRLVGLYSELIWFFLIIYLIYQIHH